MAQTRVTLLKLPNGREIIQHVGDGISYPFKICKVFIECALVPNVGNTFFYGIIRGMGNLFWTYKVSKIMIHNVNYYQIHFWFPQYHFPLFKTFDILWLYMRDEVTQERSSLDNVCLEIELLTGDETPWTFSDDSTEYAIYGHDSTNPIGRTWFSFIFCRGMIGRNYTPEREKYHWARTILVTAIRKWYRRRASNAKKIQIVAKRWLARPYYANGRIGYEARTGYTTVENMLI